MIEALNNDSRIKLPVLEEHRESLSKTDIDDLRILRQQLSNRQDWDTIPVDDLLDEFYSPNGYSCMVRTKYDESNDMQDKIVATGQLIINEIDSAGTIENIIVHEAFRGYGLGRSIMEDLLQTAKDKNLNKIELTSNESRVAAHRLYESLGFEIMGKKQKYDEDGKSTDKTCVFELEF